MADEQKSAAKTPPHTHTATATVQVEAEKVKAGEVEKPLERATAQDFEVGTEEEDPRAAAAYALREEQIEKLRVERGMAAAGNPPADE